LCFCGVARRNISAGSDEDPKILAERSTSDIGQARLHFIDLNRHLDVNFAPVDRSYAGTNRQGFDRFRVRVPAELED
jgi:hypothetical protein